MKWTKTPPTAPGFYWLRRSFIGDMPVRVYQYPHGGELAVREIGIDGERDIADIEGEWAGPILPPIEQPAENEKENEHGKG